MNTIAFATSNAAKVAVARHCLRPFKLAVKQVRLPLTEIQSASVEAIAASKAREAFRSTGVPIVVHDAAWAIMALNGFPGPYAHQVNRWLTAADLLRLMHARTDRRVMISKALCYIDQAGTKTFVAAVPGVILPRARGHGTPLASIISITGDGRSIAERQPVGAVATAEDVSMWSAFAAWYPTRAHRRTPSTDAPRRYPR